MDRDYRPDAAPYGALAVLLKSKKRAVLATVIEASGSTPQTAGASAVVTEAGLAAGTVGGGRVEASVLKAAKTALRTGRSRLLSFTLSHDDGEEADGFCGGRMRVLLDAAPARHAAVFEAASRSGLRRSGTGLMAVSTRRGEGQASSVEIKRAWLPGGPAGAAAAAAGLLRLRKTMSAVWDSRRPGLVEDGAWLRYFEPLFPRPRLIVAGAGHVGRAVARLGAFLGFEVRVLDDRPELLDARRIPEADRICAGDIAKVLRRCPAGPDTLVVIVTRGHSHDAEALRVCVRRPFGYIGVIGSQRKAGLLRQTFLEKKWASAAQWARVRTPIGLPIGSRTPEEIAVSIAAQLVAARRGR